MLWSRRSEQTEIKITATPSADANVCHFTFEDPLLTNNIFHFKNIQMSKGHPLLEELFRSLPDIKEILIDNEQQMTIATNSSSPNWRELGKEVAKIMRGIHKSGKKFLDVKILQIQKLEDSQTDLAHANISDLDLNSPLALKVQQILLEQINPAVAAHGGSISLVGVAAGKVYLKMGGGCQGCGMANATLRQGVEKTLKHSIPEITEIIDITDHSSGADPYYHTQS